MWWFSGRCWRWSTRIWSVRAKQWPLSSLAAPRYTKICQRPLHRIISRIRVVLIPLPSGFFANTPTGKGSQHIATPLKSEKTDHTDPVKCSEVAFRRMVELMLHLRSSLVMLSFISWAARYKLSSLGGSSLERQSTGCFTVFSHPLFLGSRMSPDLSTLCAAEWALECAEEWARLQHRNRERYQRTPSNGSVET